VDNPEGTLTNGIEEDDESEDEESWF
jgi:hypothetical protein